MPTYLSVERHLDALRDAVTAFVAYAGRAGMEAPVPTCPEWSVLDLVAHLGVVHRWAGTLVRGARPAPDELDGYERAGRECGEPLDWLVEGAGDLADAISTAPSDADAWVFLNDAPPPRAFWARRQCHETTMHAIDALGASVGRLPRAEEVWFGAELAADGIDELLGGFLTRPRSELRCAEEALLLVVPDDLDGWWEVALGPRPAVTTRHTAADLLPPDPDWELTGTAVALYLRLWNRTEPPHQFRALTAVEW